MDASSTSRFDVRLAAPIPEARSGRAVLASQLARLIASRQATSKAELGRVTGAARTTVDAGVDLLMRVGAIRVDGLQRGAGRGRPAEVLTLEPAFGVVLVADCGARRARLSLFDLGQRQLASKELDLPLASGPSVVLPELADRLEQLQTSVGLSGVRRTVVIGLPGPVDYRAGTVVRPPIMPGWDEAPVVAVLMDRLGGSCVLENDVNLCALGEARAAAVQHGPLLFIKVGSGVGAGIVAADGTVFRGADGAAGDIGHVRVPGVQEACACGARGCVEASAAVPALAKALNVDTDPSGQQLVLQRLARRDPEVVALVRERGEHIGEVAASLVHCLNPERLVLGGSLARASDDLLAVVRATVYQRALPLATRNLVVGPPVLGKESAMAGALALGIEQALDPDALMGARQSR